ncbi:MAG: hypothetical protein JXA96_01170, partial [Sedimentisphaerales bacterium]|nr:hypothetical protein [Sedimentisphaerales bacterium]
VMSTYKVSNNDPIKYQLIITKTVLPLFRAGWGNLNIPFMIIGTFIGFQLINEFHSPIIGGAILSIFVIWMLYRYLMSLARIVFLEKELKFVATFHTRTIPIDEIQTVKLSIVPSSVSITIRLKLKKKIFPLWYGFVVWGSTNFGPYEKTMDSIEQILSYYGISYTKSADVLVPLKKFLNRIFQRST